MNHDPTANSRNCSIDIFRLLFAVYVVALHTVPASLDSYPFLSITVQSLFRFSVPFFLMVSGYYFFKKAGKFTWKEIGLYLKRLVITYSFWSCLYFIVKFISWGYQSPKGFLFDCVYSFFLTGSYYHLWYFPALIFSVCISALFVKAGYKKTLFCVSICAYLLCYLITNGQLSPFIHVDAMSAAGKVVSLLLPFTQGLFYFVCGLWIHVLHSKYASMQKCSNLCYILPISVVLWFILIWCNHFCSLGFDLLIIAGIYLNVGLIIFVFNFCYRAAEINRFGNGQISNNDNNDDNEHSHDFKCFIHICPSTRLIWEATFTWLSTCIIARERDSVNITKHRLISVPC